MGLEAAVCAWCCRPGTFVLFCATLLSVYGYIFKNMFFYYVRSIVHGLLSIALNFDALEHIFTK